MKKLLKKRVLIPLIVIAVVAIGAAVAYAAFTSAPVTTSSNLTTATPGLLINQVNPAWNLTNLVPGTTYTETVQLKNSGSMTFNSLGLTDSLSNNASGDAGDIGSLLYVTIDGGNPISVDALASGVQISGTIVSGGYESVVLTLQLDSGADNSYAGYNFGNLSFTFTGNQ
ncbi:MAG TPA: hypothetical protein VL117_01425 [Thermoleophilia bacterium]|nr:hypothetical protein [Thermoleophilia bacterium]